MDQGLMPDVHAVYEGKIVNCSITLGFCEKSGRPRDIIGESTCGLYKL